MHNINVDALAQNVAKAKRDPATVVQHVAFEGAWQTDPGAVQFRAVIPIPNGVPVIFEADFPPPMGGTGSAPNPLAYCFWGGLACYAMTYAQEAALQGIELRGLRARVNAEVDMSRALGASDHPPVRHIDWQLEVDADAAPSVLEDLKRLADEHCPGAYCIRTPIELRTSILAAVKARTGAPDERKSGAIVTRINCPSFAWSALALPALSHDVAGLIRRCSWPRSDRGRLPWRPRKAAPHPHSSAGPTG